MDDLAARAHELAQYLDLEEEWDEEGAPIAEARAFVESTPELRDDPELQARVWERVEEVAGSEFEAADTAAIPHLLKTAYESLSNPGEYEGKQEMEAIADAAGPEDLFR